MNYDAVVRFVVASNRALMNAGTDNRVRPLLELAPPDFMEFRASIEPGLVASTVTQTRDGEIEFMGAIIRAKK